MIDYIVWMKFHRYIFFLLVLFVGDKLSAQSIANYSATRNTGISYNSIAVGGNAVNSWRSNSGLFQQDDNRSFFIPIGFDFWYNGIRYNQLCISTNGFIDFSSSADDGGAQPDDFGYNNTAFSNNSATAGTRPACAVFYDDLTAQGGTAALGNSIRYNLTGTAPNRVMTLEWIDMAVYTNTTPSLNFQVQLSESTGLIRFNYGTMNTGTFTFSYTIGINAPTMSFPPLASELKNQSAANSSTFNNTPQNNMSVMPASNSQIVFTPPTPTAVSGTLTFSAVTQTSMTLNWPNWATNEVGYVIYYSEDGTNYNFHSQTAANATNFNVTGLVAGTNYFWRLYAVTEGCLSSPLSGTQATLNGINKVSNVVNGNWNNAATWLPPGMPTAADNVTILNGHTVTINANAVCNNLTVGGGTSGTLLVGNNNTARTVQVNNITTVNTGATFNVNPASNATHSFTTPGNITNNGTLNFAVDGNSLCNSTFNKNGNQKISGAGATTNFNSVTVNLGTSELNTLTVSSSNFTAPSDFLTLTNGTFKLASTNATVLTLFSGTTADINQTCGFTLANPNANVTVAGDLNLYGNLRIESGVMNIGNAANEILYSIGGETTITGGELRVAGRFVSSTLNNLTRFAMTGGTLIVPIFGTNNNTEAPLNITSSGSVVNLSGGTIIIPREGGSGASNLGVNINNVINSNVTGGVLQIGSTVGPVITPAAQTMRISTVLPFGNLHVQSPNATAQLANALTVLDHVNILQGTLNANNFNLTLGGNWTNNATFQPTTGTVIFNGDDLQTITDPTNETFHHLSLASTDTVRLNCHIETMGNMSISAGSTYDANAGNFTAGVRGNWTNNGNVFARQGLFNFKGTAPQVMNASVLTHFFDIMTSNLTGVTIGSGTYEVEGAYTPFAGNFNVNGATSFTLLSNALRTARVGNAGVGSSITGSMIVQRFISGRSAGYSDMASPLAASTIADWDNELLLIYAYSPPSAYPSAWSYSESLWDYVPVTSSATNLTSGKGFEVYLDSYGTYTSFDQTTLDSRGTPFLGGLNISSTISNVNDGWNLIGNPYASFISWDVLRATTSNIDNDIMIYDETIGDFEIYTTGSGVELAPHQGFWVMATGAPAMSFAESNKTASFNSNFRNAKTNLFSVKVSNNDKANWFTSTTKFTINGDSDFEKNIPFRSIAHPQAPSLYSIGENGEKLRHQLLKTSSTVQTIEFGFTAGVDGNYSLNFQELEKSLPLDYTCLRLTDKETVAVKYIDAQHPSYSFYHEQGNQVNRFKIDFIKDNSCTTEDNALSGVQAYTNQQLIYITLATGLDEMNGKLTLRNALGQQMNAVMTVYNDGNYTMVMPQVAGIYLLEIELNGKSEVVKLIKSH